MANEWYVEHGGKQYGPMSSAQLKKLATDGKISPATSVRAGNQGAWVPASRVQGLFAAGSAPAPAAKPPARPQPEFDPLARPPAPPMTAPTPRYATVVPKAVPAAAPSLVPKILGAVAVVFGTLALATFWLPILGGAMGWIGIVVGGLGIVLGGAALVMAALHQGSGLFLAIGGSSSSLVGLVLSVVLGVQFGLFGKSEPPKVIVAAPPPMVAPPPVEKPPEPEPEPPKEPEIVWTPADQAIEQGPIRAKIVSAKVESVRMENADLSVVSRPKPKPMLKIVLAIDNISQDKIVEVPGWMGAGDLVGQGVGQLLGAEAGKAVQAATATATLVDNIGNAYKQTPGIMLAGLGGTLNRDIAVRPGQSSPQELVFPVPLPSVEFLRLELSPGGFSGSEPLRFEIPKGMVGGQ